MGRMNPESDKIELNGLSIESLAWRQVMNPGFIAEEVYILTPKQLNELTEVIASILTIDTSRC